MSEFVVADLHFGDKTLCSPARDGSRPRPFRSAFEMDREIVRRWNEVVAPADTVYVLGDIGRAGHARTVNELRGHKHLVAGNGDNVGEIARMAIFDSITVAKWLKGLLLTHIPVHPSQLRRNAVNVHGHLHTAVIGDPRYACVSVEQTDFRPVPLATIGVAARQRCLL